MSERPVIIVRTDGHNRTQMSIEGKHVRVDCFQWDYPERDEPGFWRHVYSALHPIEFLSTVLAGVKK